MTIITQVRSEPATETPRARTVDIKLEVVVIPVSDVKRAKRFYCNLGWRLDADFVRDAFRVVKFTPPGSSCSIQFCKERPLSALKRSAKQPLRRFSYQEAAHGHPVK